MLLQPSGEYCHLMESQLLDSLCHLTCLHFPHTIHAGGLQMKHFLILTWYFDHGMPATKLYTGYKFVYIYILLLHVLVGF